MVQFYALFNWFDVGFVHGNSDKMQDSILYKALSKEEWSWLM